MLAITLLGTGGPLPDPHRAGPATLVEAGPERYLVDAGRGVLMRLAALGLGAPHLDALLLTHLHSDHVTDLGDVVTTRWITTFEPTPLRVIGPPGTRRVVDHVLGSLAPDIAYRRAHHDDLDHDPIVDVVELTTGTVPATGSTVVTAAPTDHRPVEPSVGYRFDHGEASVVVAGDTVPCPGLDELCAGARVLVHTVVRRDVIERIPVARLHDVLDYHSSVEDAAQTAARASMETLVLTHYVPAPAPSGADKWRARAAGSFSGRVEVGDDLLRVEIPDRQPEEPLIGTPPPEREDTRR